MADTSEAKQVVIVLDDGEYECKSWQETETQYGKTYLVSIIKKELIIYLKYMQIHI